MDRNLKRRAVAPRVISRSRKPTEKKKKKKKVRCPDCLFLSGMTLFCPFCPYNVLFCPALCHFFVCIKGRNSLKLFMTRNSLVISRGDRA